MGFPARRIGQRMKLNLVPARQGFHWVRQGLLATRRQPFNLIGLLGMVACGAMLMIGLPVVGPLIVVALMPLVWMGFMLATRRTLAGERVTPSVFAEPLKGAGSPRRAFAQLGGAYLGATVLVMLLAQWFGPGAEVLAEVFDTAKDAAEIMSSPAVQQDVMWRLLLTLPVSLMFWHTPALVLWARMPVAKAIFFSAVATWRNLGAFAVYGLSWGMVVIALGVLAQLIMSLLPVPLLASVLTVTMGMAVSTAFYASLYFTVIDCFDAPEADQDVNRVTPPSGQA
jgi:hypothetical protein